MRTACMIVSLPTKDLRKAFTFYRDGLGLTLAIATKGDEMPEPVEFALNEGAHLMLVPSKGFGWVVGNGQVAEAGVSECVVSYCAATRAEVKTIVERARAAGGIMLAPPAQNPWGYAGTFRDLDGHVWMVVTRSEPA